MKPMVTIAAMISASLSITCCVFGMADGVEIRVKLLDAHSGKPYVKRDVEFFGTNGKHVSLTAHDIIFDRHAKTDSEGIAQFQLNAPLPSRLIFYSAQANGCGPPGFPEFVTEDVVRYGVVVENTCAGKHQRYRWQDVTARPGEIVIFAVEPRGP
jgi:hypothetical protein